MKQGLIGTDKFHNFRLWNNNTKVLNDADTLRKKLNLPNYKVQAKTDFIVNLLLNLKLSAKNNRPLLISHAKTYYDGVPKKNVPTYQSYDTVTNVLKALVTNGYLEKRRAIAKRVRTGYHAKDPIKLFLNNIQFKEIFISRPKTYIIMRKKINGKKKDVKYTVTKESLRIESDLKKYNDLREAIPLSFEKLPENLFKAHKQEIQDYAVDDLDTLTPVNNEYNIKLKTTYLVRIFNKNFKNSGRFYRGLESTISRELRPELFINGNATCELDYKSLHPRILYDLRNLNQPASFDPYEAKPNISKELRDVYKQIFLIMINAKDKTSAIKAFTQKINKASKPSMSEEYYEDDDTYDYNEMIKVIGDNSKETKKQLVEDLVEHNKLIKGDLFKEKCHILMNKDSNLAHKILMHFADKGILVLCVHDSFIIEENHEAELKKVMEDVYFDEFKYLPIVEKK